MWDVVVGNPPFGTPHKGNGCLMHLKIMKNSLSLCRDFLCFIMPSRPIKLQLEKEWYDMFRTAVCTKVDVVEKDVFPVTDMDKTAIYFCDRKAEHKDLCRKFDVDRRVYEMIDEEGHRLFIDKIKRMNNLAPIGFNRNLHYVIKQLKDNSFYISVKQAGPIPSVSTVRFISSTLKDIPVMTKEQVIDFCKVKARKNFIECPSYEYGVNLKKLFCESLVFKYGLWLTQTYQNIYAAQFKYIPSLDYSKIDNDLDLLLACGFTREEADTVLTYLSTFDFTRNRNDMVRDLP